MNVHRTSMGETPYSLVYYMEALSPIQVEIRSIQVLTEIELEEVEQVRSRYDQLYFIEEKMLTPIVINSVIRSVWL